MAKYVFKPVLKTVKQSFYMEDENGRVVYEGNMTKFSLFGAAPHEFINHITNKTEVHKIGKTITAESGNGGVVTALSRTSSFKFDGQKIWDYLHDLGIRIDSTLSGGKLGMTYDITFKGQPLATAASTTPKGKSIVTLGHYYDVECEEKDLDLVFLVVFAIARTDQAFYN